MTSTSHKPSFLRSFAPTSLGVGIIAGVILSSLSLHQAKAQEATPTPATTATPEIQVPANAGPNVALKKKFVSSEPNISGWNAGLVDGSWKEAGGLTFATGNSPTFPKTATIDLEKPFDVGLVLVGVPAFGSTKNVVISVSTDGTTFTEVGSHEFGQGKTEKYLYSFPPKSAQYVRLTYVDHHDKVITYPNTFAFTTEVEVYAPAK